MTMQLDGLQTFVPLNAKDRSLAARLLVETAAIIVAVPLRILGELADMIREDISHGRIERQLEDWER